jgi:hypothetical protein
MPNGEDETWSLVFKLVRLSKRKERKTPRKSFMLRSLFLILLISLFHIFFTLAHSRATTFLASISVSFASFASRGERNFKSAMKELIFNLQVVTIFNCIFALP